MKLQEALKHIVLFLEEGIRTEATSKAGVTLRRCLFEHSSDGDGLAQERASLYMAVTDHQTTWPDGLTAGGMTELIEGVSDYVERGASTQYPKGVSSDVLSALKSLMEALS